jgi:hypothetical protein
VLGPKFLLVPLLIASAYFGTGYLAWSLGHVLVGVFGKKLQQVNIFLVPFVASLVIGTDIGGFALKSQWEPLMRVIAARFASSLRCLSTPGARKALPQEAGSPSVGYKHRFG